MICMFSVFLVWLNVATSYEANSPNDLQTLFVSTFFGYCLKHFQIIERTEIIAKYWSSCQKKTHFFLKEKIHHIDIFFPSPFRQCDLYIELFSLIFVRAL